MGTLVPPRRHYRLRGFRPGAGNVLDEIDAPPLRYTAIASNLAFIAYAAIGSMPPILILHSILLPMNVMRLSQMDHDTGHQGVRLLRRLSRLHVSS